MSTELEIHRDGAIQVLAMNRPARHHAVNRAMSDALINALDAAEGDGETRVVVLTGTGQKAFCAGQDMLEASGIEPGARDPRSSSAMAAVERLETCRLPVIAAINGYCFGGGAALAIAADIRLAARHASFRLPGAEYGLVVGAASLPRLVGVSRAKDWIFTARRFEAEEACTAGLVSGLYDSEALMPAAMALAERIAANSPVAVQESKRVIDLATQVDAAYTSEKETNLRLRATDEQQARFRDATQRVTGR